MTLHISSLTTMYIGQDNIRVLRGKGGGQGVNSLDFMACSGGENSSFYDLLWHQEGVQKIFLLLWTSHSPLVQNT